MNTLRPSSWILFILLAFGSTHVWSFGNSMPASKPDAIAHSATVMETMSSAGYTYIRVEEKGKNFWIAIPETKVTVGEKISFYEQMLMENFTSQSLNRTFDRILFVEAINKGAELPTKAITESSQHKQPPVKISKPQKPQKLGNSIGRFSIKEIFEKKDELVGKVIEVKGKVIKLSSKIMARDWVHIEDGSGSIKEMNNRIILRTTQAGIAVGDEVTGKGMLYTNKDFGYGYFYPVILEDAVFIK